MFDCLLIANRGEIARRIARTARRMGIATVAVYSDADAGAAHVREADRAIRIGAPPAAESYLKGDAIIAAARASGAEAIHPGYGFLSENADFAQAVIDAGVVWVGPPPAAIRTMGLKDAAKRLMAQAGVPVTPGYLGEDQSDATLAGEAAAIGWPVMIKAVAGGGGRGMRRVSRAEDFADALMSARREAIAAFGDDRVLLERAIRRPRHIEVQIFGDKAGDIVHLFERDCSLQRRHQKVIEEAPAPGMDAAAREAVCAAAVLAAGAVAYEGAGTIEFIADASEGLRADRIWFMEMNTRLQVEHPVTEAITGLDLVEWQLRVAAGEPLPLAQEQITMRGHAIEARLYAEDPANGFLPSSGRLSFIDLPADIRVDSGFETGDELTPYYDPLIAKLIAYADDRPAALSTLRDSCARTRVWPVKTNAGFLARLVERQDVRNGEIETELIANASLELTTAPAPSQVLLTTAALAVLDEVLPRGAVEPWAELQGFRLNGPTRRLVRLQWDETEYQVDADADDADGVWDEVAVVREQPDGPLVGFQGGEAYVFRAPAQQTALEGDGGDGAILSPMPGRIVAVAVKVGDAVVRGAPLATVEAMKMEHVLAAPFDGLVTEVKAEVGQQVSEGILLVRMEATPSAT